ncbi:hypothetical protein [Methylocapsa aurea]|uniref:hypothetical protein n=1 Tax=Methylocapsa aurea TaxID=663610 RepID=UPI0012EB8C60|nr:hypothetical protein [Methylocapsa aurea]
MSHAPIHPEPSHRPFPHGFRRVRLELAREKNHPGGSAQDGYILIIPLDAEGRIDVESWREHRDLCRIVRFRAGEDDEIGHLRRKPGGSWTLHYDAAGGVEDENIRHLENDHFIIGDYIAIREEDELHTFQVASVDYV